MVAASSCAGEGEGSLVVVLVADRGDSSRGQVQRREAAMARPWPGSADARRRGGAWPGARREGAAAPGRSGAAPEQGPATRQGNEEEPARDPGEEAVEDDAGDAGLGEAGRRPRRWPAREGGLCALAAGLAESR